MGKEGGPYESRLRELVNPFVMGRALRGEPMFGARMGAGLAGAAVRSVPGSSTIPEAFRDLREQTWVEPGAMRARGMMTVVPHGSSRQSQRPTFISI